MINGDSSESAHFIFANLNGTISAWSSVASNGTTAVIQVPLPLTGTVPSYTGLAINQAQNRLYAANNAAGTIDVFNSSFKPDTTIPSGAFTKPAAFGSLVPFNVQDLNGQVYVTYAPAGHPTHAALGAGAVAIFDENGNQKQTLMDGHLAAPWGLAIASSNFGGFSNDLLVGNFSYVNSFISAFASDSTGHLTFQGTIPIDVGNGNTAGGLWSLIFGNAGMNGSPDTLYFSDGIDGEMKGLIGAINAVPLPAALPLFATGLGALGLLGWRRKKKAIAA